MTAKSMLLSRQQVDARHRAMVLDLHRTFSSRSEKQATANSRLASHETTYASQITDKDVDYIIAIIEGASSSINRLEEIIAHRDSVIEHQNKTIDQMRANEEELYNKISVKEQECSSERERAERVEGLLASCEKQARDLEVQSAASQSNLAKLTRAVRDSLRSSSLPHMDNLTAQQSPKAVAEAQTTVAGHDNIRGNVVAM